MGDVNLNPYLNFSGDTRDAMEFYRQVFGGELEVMTFSDLPGTPAPPGYEDKVMHAALRADDVTLMASEGQPGSQVTVGDNVQLSLSGTDEKKLSTYFSDLSDGGRIRVPLGPQPWGDTFGMVTDRFGVHWMVNITKT